MNTLELINLPEFTTLTRNTDTTILNIIIEDCPKLTSLDLSFDKQFTIATLIIDNVGLTELILSINSMIHTAEFSNCYDLEVLNLSNTRLRSVSFENMDALIKLGFDQITQVSDYTFLSEASNLVELSIAANNLDDSKMSYISTMDYLREINLSYNPDIKNYNFLSSFVVLEYLSLAFNEIDTEAFNSIPLLNSLVELDISDNPDILDISVENMPNLFTLDISSTVSNWYIDTLELSGLSSFKEFVRTGKTKINTVILTDLPVIETLNLGNSGVTQITLSNLVMLKELDISYNSDISITIE
jgi:Leucine-rich repeat (LRR) protein